MGLGLGIAGWSSIWLERYEEISVWSCFYKPRDLISPIYIYIHRSLQSINLLFHAILIAFTQDTADRL